MARPSLGLTLANRGVVLRSRGASPYAATLSTMSGPAGPLDPARTLGARLSLT